MGYDPEEETLANYPEARCLQLIRAAVGIPDLPAQLKTVLTWEMNALEPDTQGKLIETARLNSAREPVQLPWLLDQCRSSD